MNINKLLIIRIVIVSSLVGMFFPGCAKREEITLDSGVRITDMDPGEGQEAGYLDRVTLDYSGYLIDGTLFDSSKKPGRESLRFTIGAEEVIPGLEEGVRGMRPGGKRLIKIPASLAYGKEGAGESVPPDSDLEFEVELLKIERFD